VGVSNGIMIVGAPYYGDEFQGQAFLVNTGTGAFTALADPYSTYDGFFGTSVAIDGIYAAVGAPGENGNGTDPLETGNVYVYNVSDGALVRTITSGNPQEDGTFGQSVAVSGADVLAGAPTESPTGEPTEAGAAYLFNGTTGAPLASFHSSAPVELGDFGGAVALSGLTAVVGAPSETVGGHTYSGATYVFLPTTISSWTEIRTTSPNAQHTGEFGYSVAASGHEVFVGAYLETDGAFVGAGRVYQFATVTGLTDSVSYVATYYSPDPTSNGAFGISIATNGAVLVVGASAEDGDGIDFSGNVYVFAVAGGILQDHYFSPWAVYGGAFGQSVGVGPGGVIVAGAPYENPSPTQSGAAYVL